MARFNVHLITSSGESHEEVMDAADQMGLYDILKGKNETLISATEIGEGTLVKNFSLTKIFNKIFNSKVKYHDKIIFARNLSSMLEAGLPLSRALAVIEKQTSQKKFKSVISDLGKGISQGSTLGDTMKNFGDAFPPLMISMVKAGEESGSLAQSLRVVATQMESSYQLTKKIKGALLYPCIVLGAMVIIAFFMLTYVVPTLSSTFKELHANLPLSTRIIINSSDFVEAHFILTIVGALILVAVVYFGIKTPKGKIFMDFAVLHIPIIGNLSKEINSARTARTLSSLLSSGVDFVVAVKITTDVVQNSYYKAVLRIVGEKIQKGDTIAQVFNEHQKLYPSFVGEMVSVGEETGQLAQMLLGVATFYETEVDQKTKDMSSIIEPFLMVFIGLAVGLFAVSMISPIYSLGDSIN